jgi:2-methylisocitrate lyase-like PEP mutase family enzyme
VRHTVRSLERAGANAIQLEDQVMPKKCGHFSDKSVVDASEMVAKIRAAVDARQSDDFLIIARTDSRAIHGLDHAIDRARLYAENGADITFVEAPENIDELRRIPLEIACPQLVNIVIGGKTPSLSQKAFTEMGFGIVLYANAALQGAMRGMTNALSHLKEHGELTEDLNLVASFEERQKFVQKPFFDELDGRYKK